MTLSVRRFTVVVFGLILFFFVAHGIFTWIRVAFDHDYVFGITPLFRLDNEQSFSTWYSSLALVVSAVLLLAIYRVKAAQLDPFARHWLGLAVIFVFLSADEACSIHEKFSMLFRMRVSTLGLESGQWTAVYAVPAVVFAVIYWPFLRSLWPKPGIMFAAAGAVFVTGAVGFELLPAYYTTATNLFSKVAVHLLIAGFEELLEMLGIFLWMRALLVYISNNNISLQVKLEP